MRSLVVLILLAGVAHADPCQLRRASCHETRSGDRLLVSCVGAPHFVIAVQHDGEWQEQPMLAGERCMASATIDVTDYSVEIAEGEQRTPVEIDRPVVETQAEAPLPRPSRCSMTGVYGEPMLMTDLHGVFVRHDLGAVLRECDGDYHGRQFRFGASFDLSARYQAAGIETELSFPIRHVADLGIRAEVGTANHSQTIYSIGVRARIDYAFLAVDYIAAHNDGSNGRSIIAGVGISGRRATWLLAIEASVALLALALVH